MASAGFIKVGHTISHHCNCLNTELASAKLFNELFSALLDYGDSIMIHFRKIPAYDSTRKLSCLALFRILIKFRLAGLDYHHNCLTRY